MATISDILIAKGRSAGNAAQTKGNIYADLISNLSSAPGRFMQEQRQNRAADARDQEAQQRLAISKGQLDQQTNEFKAQQEQAATASRVDAVLGSGVYDDAGNIDLDAVRERAGLTDPSLVPHAVAAAQKLNEHTAGYRKTVADAESAQLKLDEQKRNAVGDTAATLAANPNGIDPGAYQLAIGSFVKNKLIDPKQAEDWLAAETPDAMAAAVQGMIANSKAGAPGEVKEFDPTKELRDTKTGKVIRPGAPKVEKLTYGQPTTVSINGARTLVRAGSDGQTYDMRGKVVDGAAITPDSGMTPYQQAEIDRQRKQDLEKAAEKAAKAAQGKPLPAIEADKISDLQKSVSAVDDLATSLEQGATGSVAAFEANHVPQWATNLTGIGAEAKATKADIVRAQQIVGRILHGGVLRKNDQEAAAAYMPQQDDSPAVIKSKLDHIREFGKKAIEDHVGNLGRSGYDVSNFQPAKTGGAFDVVAPNGKTYTFTSQADADAFKAKF